MHTRAVALLAALTLSSGLLAQTTTSTPTARRAGVRAAAPHVIVISIDGLAAYALADPNVPLPNLRRLARDGVAAEAMLPVNPTVTWANHTTMVTGVTPERHGLLFNGLPMRVLTAATETWRVEPHVDKTTLVTAPTVYDLAFAAGLTTAEIDWVAIENAPTITWSFLEYSKPDGALQREMVKAGMLTEEELRQYPGSPITFRDEIWTRAAEYLIKAHAPNLLLFHLLATDSMQHAYGARSLGAQASLALADARVGRLIEASRAAGQLSQTTFVVVSDHGFRSYKRLIHANAVLKARGLSDRAFALSEGGTAIIYVTGGAAATETIDAVRAAFTGVEGVSGVITPSEFPRYGYPSPTSMTRMGQVVVAAGEDYAFDGSGDGQMVEDVPRGANTGNHGYLNTDPDMRAIFIASGARVKRDATLGTIRNLDVAPTIAALLGIAMKDVEGQVLPILR